MPDTPITLDDVRAVPGIDSAERIELRPGDLVVVRMPPNADNQECHNVFTQLRQILDGTDIKTIIIVGGGVMVGAAHEHHTHHRPCAHVVGYLYTPRGGGEPLTLHPADVTQVCLRDDEDTARTAP